MADNATVQDAAHQEHARMWDERYAERDQHWSGQPNHSLVVEAGDLTPGTALDVGCGEGADAIWLARQGWTVTGLDISKVAVGRAEQAANEAGADIEWIAGDLTEGVVGDREFDLVALHYPAIPKEDADATVKALMDATAPGGTLLVVGHDFEGSEHGRQHAEERGFDPNDHVQPPDVAAALGEGWVIAKHESRPREMPEDFQGPAVPDVVLRARRAAEPG